MRTLAGVILGLTIAASGAGAQELDATEQALIDYVRAHAEEQLEFLERIVNINSGTMNFDGVREVGEIFVDELSALGFTAEMTDERQNTNRAGHVVAYREGERGAKLLLIGHLDTVFEPSSPFQTFAREGDRATGPGVEDMKGGDAVMLYALKALNAAGALDGAEIRIVITGDEEFAGQPVDAARAPLIQAAEMSDIALNFEAGAEGQAVSSRRGSSAWRLETTGVRAHSSGIFGDEQGAGAIYEAARILNGFYTELREEYLTYNPGVILGGTDVDYDPEATAGSAFGKTNVIAQRAVVDGDLRFISEEQKERARMKMREIAAQNLPQTGAELFFLDKYPAMSPTPANAALLEFFSDVSADLGYGPVEGNDPARRGAADISFAAPIVSASMDGLGPFGGRGHTVEEWMDVPSLRMATERAAVLIYRLTREDAPAFGE